jgi:thymidylate synthase (FAD)
MQDLKNRQNSFVTTDAELQNEWVSRQTELAEHSQKAYNWALENGIAKEQARAVLPEGMTMTRMYMNGTLRSWVHYIQLRSSNGTQKEHMDIAKECNNVIQTIFPLISKIIKTD